MNSDTKIIGGMLAATVIVITAILVFGSQSKSVNTEPIKVDEAKLIQDYSPRRGPDTAPVRIVEFSDFQCPACARVAPMLDQANIDYGDQIQLIYRYFPLTQTHQNAQLTSQAGAAAQAQGKFWEFAHLLFQNQNEWSTSNDIKTVLQGYATTLGLDTTQFKKDMTDQKLIDHIRRDVGDANALSINSTPTIYINGKKIQSPSTYADLKQIIDENLRSAETVPTE